MARGCARGGCPVSSEISDIVIVNIFKECLSKKKQ